MTVPSATMASYWTALGQLLGRQREWTAPVRTWGQVLSLDPPLDASARQRAVHQAVVMKLFETGNDNSNTRLRSGDISLR